MHPATCQFNRPQKHAQSHAARGRGILRVLQWVVGGFMDGWAGRCSTLAPPEAKRQALPGDAPREAPLTRTTAPPTTPEPCGLDHPSWPRVNNMYRCAKQPGNHARMQHTCEGTALPGPCADPCSSTGTLAIEATGSGSGLCVEAPAPAVEPGGTCSARPVPALCRETWA